MLRATPERPVRIGISSCLLGESVRYDGGHKRDTFLTESLGRFVEWVPICPEVECGLGTPRESMRLVGHPQGIRLLTVRTGLDHTAKVRNYAVPRVASLAGEDLSGYVLKKDSPTCGLERVKVYTPGGMAERTGRGLYAAALVEQHPHLPVEEEGRLHDPGLRENFIERVFCYRRLRSLFGSPWTIGDFVAFHTAHKLMLMAHSPPAYQRLGRLVAAARGLDRTEVARTYTDLFSAALACVPTRRRHVNVLQHVLGYFSRELDGGSRAEMLTAIEDYRRGLVPLVVPITLVRHHVRRHEVSYLEGQLYLDPHPKELMLRAVL